MESEKEGLISSNEYDFDEEEIRRAKEEKYKKKSLLILEPAAFLLFFAFNVSGVVLVDQVDFQTCTAVLNFNESDCLKLGTENKTEFIQELQDIVQPYTAKIMMKKSLMEFILPTFFSLFIGPWSDKFGRKPLILAPFIGYFFTFLLISIISSLSSQYQINPAYYSFAYLPAAFSGGYCTLFTGLFCYITDVTTERNRAVRMGVLEAAIYLGLLGGSLSSSHILNSSNATTVFAIAAGTIFTGVIYIKLCINESIAVTEMNKKKSKIRELFKLSLVRDMFATCFKRRANNDRAIIVLIMGILGATIFANQGAGTVFYLFVRSKFEWTIRDINYYDAVNIVLLIIGNIIGMFMIKKIFGASEVMLAVIAYLSYMINSSIKAFASQSWHLYLATVLGLLKGLAEPTCRALVSNIAPGTDIGKIFSLTTAIESLSPVAAAPLYAYVYSTTLKTYIGAFNFISTWIYFMCLALLFVVYMFQKAHHNMSTNHVPLSTKS